MKIARTTIDEVGLVTPQRRQFSPAFKSALVRRCQAESVASVALDHGINPVTVHRWIRESRERLRRAGPVPPAFVALHLAAPSIEPAAVAPPAPPPTGNIRIDLQGSGISASVSWPLGSADACAAWLRALLQSVRS